MLQRSKSPLASNVFVMRHGGNECRLRPTKVFAVPAISPLTYNDKMQACHPRTIGEPRQNPYSHQQAAIL